MTTDELTEALVAFAMQADRLSMLIMRRYLTTQQMGTATTALFEFLRMLRSESFPHLEGQPVPGDGPFVAYVVEFAKQAGHVGYDDDAVASIDFNRVLPGLFERNRRSGGNQG